ncbi:hypothetical protein HPB50_022061 [Hyalomma asiaticum]|uniref:Uncharacterized protein n=1 Tax=Hyalomma asiaticum TaxID=266040 RepID=A0ACB7SBC9_HYAAI|nr:hypothetical protein HPB50_022061 [Hyalomma asiaticum]
MWEPAARGCREERGYAGVIKKRDRFFFSRAFARRRELASVTIDGPACSVPAARADGGLRKMAAKSRAPASIYDPPAAATSTGWARRPQKCRRLPAPSPAEDTRRALHCQDWLLSLSLEL